MRARPGADEYGGHFGHYIALAPEGDLIEALKRQGEDTVRFIGGLTEEQALHRYEPDKWSIKEVFGHIADTERVMSYRLLRIARGDTTPLPGFDQELFVAGEHFASRTLEELAADYAAVRQATLTLLRGLSEEAWLRKGTASNTTMSARALACVISGHELHHLLIVKERYLA
ncbi:DinB family protein [Cohnella fermenti]|uniref:DinB family protein n=1 Tax=Cohnella fermenti TaxID=2565925 RepID=A0A4S4BZM6_9BACL|nr:DinB family protein [Cohnella fermenti]THF80730.1 DinB family protein [Cohnella fermenti]